MIKEGTYSPRNVYLITCQPCKGGFHDKCYGYRLISSAPHPLWGNHYQDCICKECRP